MDIIPENIRGTLLIIFFASWAIVRLIGWLYFLGNKNIDLKRRFNKWTVIVYAIMFFFLVAPGSESPPFVLLFVAAAIALVVFLNLRNTIYCNDCGKVYYHQGWFNRVKYCAKCGAKLPDK
jgi:hypothetical protein